MEEDSVAGHHIGELTELLKRSRRGFLLRELSRLIKLLNVCADKVADNPACQSLLCEALKICSRHFLMEKASDEYYYAHDIIALLAQIGCLMRVQDSEVQLQICDTVKSFYSSSAPTQPVDRLQPTSASLRLHLVEQSGLARTLVFSLAAVRDQRAVKLQLLQTLQLLSSTSDVNCALMLNARGAERICLHMNEPGPSLRLLNCSAEILWNLVERGSKATVTAQLSSMECVMSLKEAFMFVMLSGEQEKSFPHLRNDLLEITTVVAENPNCMLIESLFARELMFLATSPELNAENHLGENLRIHYNDEDFHMKRLLLNLAASLATNIFALQLFRDCRMMRSLMTLIKPPPACPEQRPGHRQWTPAQQEALQLQALDTLSAVAPFLLDDYMSCHGDTCVMLLLEWCVSQDPDVKPEDSFHGAGGRGSKRTLLWYWVRALRSITSVGQEAINQDLCDQGIISNLLEIMTELDSCPEEENEMIVETKRDIQCILALVCEKSTQRKELFGTEGVDMAVQFLKRGTEKFYSGLGHNKLILSTLDCVWSCIVGCYTTEDYFLVKGGMFLLLDLLSSGPRSIHGVILATMVEVLNNLTARHHALAWSKGNLTAHKLLLRLWRYEEAKMEVSRDEHGGIADTSRPLQGRYQPPPQLSRPSDEQSPTVAEIPENLRSKIFCIFSKIGFQIAPELDAEDHVTFSIIKKYLNLKVAEVWEEISTELRPIISEHEPLDIIAGITEDTTRATWEEQRNFLQKRLEDNIKEEELLYEEIKTVCKQQELQAKSWKNLVLRTSDYNFLKGVKAQTESTRPKPEEGEADVQLLEHFIGQVMTMDKTPALGPAGMKVTLARTSIKGALTRAIGESDQDTECDTPAPL